MKKIMTVFVAALLLSACGNSKEQQDLKQVLTEKFKDDSDLKDYKLKPEDIADCVVANISQDAPPIPGIPSAFATSRPTPSLLPLNRRPKPSRR